MRTMTRCYLRVSPLKKAAAIYAAAAFLVQMILLLGVHGALPAILAQTLKLDGADTEAVRKALTEELAKLA